MNTADVLDAVRGAGLRLAVAGDDLVLESFGPPPGPVLDLIRIHKFEIIAAIIAPNIDGQENDAAIGHEDFHQSYAIARLMQVEYWAHEIIAFETAHCTVTRACAREAQRRAGIAVSHEGGRSRLPEERSTSSRRGGLCV